MNNYTAKNIIIGLIGIGAGVFIAKVLYQKKYEDYADEEIAYVKDNAQQAIDSLTDELNAINGIISDNQDDITDVKRIIKTLDGDGDHIPHVVTRSKNSLLEYGDKIDEVKTILKVIAPAKVQYNKMVKNYGNKSASIDEYEQAQAERQAPLDDENEDIYLINAKEFCEERTEYEKITLTYYDEDDVLTDDNEDIIDDVEGTIGSEAYDNFGMNENEPNVVYVRNTNLTTDYEICKTKMSYKKNVLGFDK